MDISFLIGWYGEGKELNMVIITFTVLFFLVNIMIIKTLVHHPSHNTFSFMSYGHGKSS